MNQDPTTVGSQAGKRRNDEEEDVDSDEGEEPTCTPKNDGEELNQSDGEDDDTVSGRKKFSPILSTPPEADLVNPWALKSSVTISNTISYPQTSNIRCIKSPKWNVSRLAVVFAQSIEVRC